MTTASEILQAALAHHRAGRLADAAQLYERVLAADPRNAAVLHLLGVAVFQSGQVDKAIEIVSTAIRYDGGRADYHASLGDMLRAAGRGAEAKACLQRAISLDPNSPLAYYSLALAHHAQGELEDAVARCCQAVAIKPDFAAAHNDLGNILRKLD